MFYVSKSLVQQLTWSRNMVANQNLKTASFVTLHLLNLIPIILVAMVSRSLTDHLGSWALLPAGCITLVLTWMSDKIQWCEKTLYSYGFLVFYFTTEPLLYKFADVGQPSPIQLAPITWYIFYFMPKFLSRRK